jgi:uncharacterized protein (UPF0332 family)
MTLPRGTDRRGRKDPMDRDLLAVATLLAWTEQGLPKHAMMRRAVSTAYYALFHALADRCAKTLVTSSGSDWDTFTLVYRALDHASAKRFFEMRDVERSGAEIASLARVFVNLRQARITADYLPTRFPYGQKQVIEFVEQAREGCEVIAKISTGNMRRLAAQIIFKRR